MMVQAAQSPARGTPQAAIFVEETSFHWFQHFAVAADATAEQILSAVRTVHEAAASVNLLVGFGTDMTARLPVESPVGLKDFTEAGLYFLAFTDDLAKIDLMLAAMFGATGDGGADRLVTFSKTVSGAYYFAPPRETLERLGVAT